MNLMNAAGTCKDFWVARSLAAHRAVDEITVGSYTPERSVGFPDAYLCDANGTSYNAKAMPNCGLDEFLRQLPDFIGISHSHGKKLRVSIAAPTIPGFRHMLRAIADKAGDNAAQLRFEMNPACPNDRKMFNAYDPVFIERLVHMLGSERFEGLHRAVKLTLIAPSMPLFKDTVRALKRARGSVQEVVACNTYPDTYKPWSGKFAHRGHFAAMGGEGLHPLALGMLKALSHELPKHITLTGVGGISDMSGITRMSLVGARHFQIGTAFINKGAAVFDGIGAFSLD